MKTLNDIMVNERLSYINTGMDGGQAIIRMPSWYGTVIWSFSGGWEHVSVAPRQRKIIPSWEDMCLLKDMFFDDCECVVQYHPSKSECVNNLSNCLHLWRPIFEHLPTPPSIMVGLKGVELE